MSKEILKTVARLVKEEVFINEKYAEFREGFEIIYMTDSYLSNKHIVIASFDPRNGGSIANCMDFEVCADREGNDCVNFRGLVHLSKKDKTSSKRRFKSYEEVNEEISNV